MSCGRLFEGTAEEMWSTLKRIRALPANTIVYCAHEYFERSFKFARVVDQQNEMVLKRGQEIKARLHGGQMGAQFALGDELDVNPFLRADDEAFQRQLGMAGADPVEVFAELRRRRDEM